MQVLRAFRDVVDEGEIGELRGSASFVAAGSFDSGLAARLRMRESLRKRVDLESDLPSS